MKPKKLKFKKGFTLPNFSKENLGGFTLIEILIVITISLILSSSLILYSRVSTNQLVLFKDRAKFFSTLYRTKALSVETYGDPSSLRVCGFGINIAPPRDYLIFKETAANCSSLTQSDHVYSSADSGDSVVDSFRLDPATNFDAPQQTDIFFSPPDPKIYLSPTPASGEAIIVIKSLDGSSMSVKINDAGQITL